MTAHYRRMAEAMIEASAAGRFVDSSGNFHFSDWVDEEFDPGRHAHPHQLPIDGCAYRRRTRRRKP